MFSRFMSQNFQVHVILIFLVLIKLTYNNVVHSTKFYKFPPFPHSFSAVEPYKEFSHRLIKPLIGEDGRVYSCSERTLFAFESNGTIAWTLVLNYTCNVHIAPVHGGSRKIYLVAENRVLKINPLNIGKTESAIKVFFGPEASTEHPGEILGLAISISSSCLLINVKQRGLFAYRLHGSLLWSAGPILYQHGYRQGCRKNITGCYFNSVPVIDHCEATVYMSNNEGELYAISIRSPHFLWVQDLTPFDKVFTILPGNNGILYVTLPVRGLILALDVSRGNILWQGSIGPLSTADYEPVLDSNGWISIGSLDGFLYSFSPTGDLKKFPEVPQPDSVIQVPPVLDCSGSAIYISQTKMEGQNSLINGEYTHVTAMKPKSVTFTMLIPSTGKSYWSETYPGALSSNLSRSDLRYFVLDEGILLAFIAASRNGNPFSCRSTRQQIVSSCSQIEPEDMSVYMGNEKAILLFLLLESAILILLAVAVRFCLIFWKKKKLQNQDLGKFLEKRRSLQLQKKAFDRTITELEKEAAKEAVANELLEKMGNLVKERQVIEKKLLTSYSLGRDEDDSKSKSQTLLPLHDNRTRSYSFRGVRKESVTLFHTLSDTSEVSSCDRKGKGKVYSGDTDDDIHETDYSSEDEIYEVGSTSRFRGENWVHELKEKKMNDEGERRSIRRRTSFK